ncbi:hypothetical protein SERLADRAFT_441871 [Serpula lacrymans var. lacrymans S7.9]|uniref:Uncharacterized protein n=1 Tax=Serpula lacrymans var. lacrymans (strain S7.9) TaxID=578457 RepID=F8P7X0_SERL9|nr:uncharacterized protein SERLADRAFT_441871 [Serpula lacrymans var. lacrymans S7.9]EGO20528.1 hypothetical protein SERLADRAFT_441871 [Serpula lacrymans var. lacrymans S7.9]
MAIENLQSEWTEWTNNYDLTLDSLEMYRSPKFLFYDPHKPQWNLERLILHEVFYQVSNKDPISKFIANCKVTILLVVTYAQYGKILLVWKENLKGGVESGDCLPDDSDISVMEKVFCAATCPKKRAKKADEDTISNAVLPKRAQSSQVGGVVGNDNDEDRSEDEEDFHVPNEEELRDVHSIPSTYGYIEFTPQDALAFQPSQCLDPPEASKPVTLSSSTSSFLPPLSLFRPSSSYMEEILSLNCGTTSFDLEAAGYQRSKKPPHCPIREKELTAKVSRTLGQRIPDIVPECQRTGVFDKKRPFVAFILERATF